MNFFALIDQKLHLKTLKIFPQYNQEMRTIHLVERANNVHVIKNPISGKIFAKCYAVLSRKWVMSRFCTFWWHFLVHFGSLCYFFLAFCCTIWVFRAFKAVLSQIRFVVIYTLFWINYFDSNLACVKKKLSFCISASG